MHKAPTLSLAKKLWFKTLLSNLLASGYNKTEIAQRIGISPQRLTNLINGSDSVSDKVIDSFSSVFQLGNISIESENSILTGRVSDSLKEKNMEDFEQKYNELVEAARAVIEANPGLSKIDKELGRLSKLLPEKESEDERIRKKLIDFINHYRHNTDLTSEQAEWCKKALAYLEKQKDEVQKQFNLGVQAGREEAMYEMEKEQKPVKLNDDTEVGLDRALQIVKHAKGNLCCYQSDDGIYKCDHAIQTLEHILKNGIEQKPAGASEDDKKIIEEIILCLEYLQREDTEQEYNGDHNVNPKRYTVMIDKLKSFLE